MKIPLSFSWLQKSIYSALVFFGTLMILTLTYAATTYYSDLPTTSSGSGLTATSWNNLVNYTNKAVKQDMEVLTVTGGKVGIGTVSPAAKLEVNGDVMTKGVNDTRFTSYSNDISGGISGFQGYAAGAAGGFILASPVNGSISHITTAGNYDTYLTARYAHNLIFGTNSVERVRIDSTGNVGIGTANPMAQLHISGEGTIQSTTTDAEYIGFVLPRTTVNTMCSSGTAYKFSKTESTKITKTGDSLCSAHGKTCTDIYGWYLTGVNATSYSSWNPAATTCSTPISYFVWPYADLGSQYMGADTVNWWGVSVSVCCI